MEFLKENFFDTTWYIELKFLGIPVIVTLFQYAEILLHYLLQIMISKCH